VNEDLGNALEILNARKKVAEDKRADLEIQIRETDTELLNLGKAISRILTLLGSNITEPISELGITDAIRRVTSTQTRMTPGQVRDELQKQGFDLSVYQNPMASIYKILTRLQEGGELDVEREGWSTFYKAKPRLRHRHHKHVHKRRWIQAALGENPKVDDVK
jgi:hypothetical protein